MLVFFLKSQIFKVKDVWIKPFSLKIYFFELCFYMNILKGIVKWFFQFFLIHFTKAISIQDLRKLFIVFIEQERIYVSIAWVIFNTLEPGMIVFSFKVWLKIFLKNIWLNLYWHIDLTLVFLFTFQKYLMSHFYVFFFILGDKINKIILSIL
jgi:hypothetical protein